MCVRRPHPPTRSLDRQHELPLASVLPPLLQTADFIRTVWPQATQEALLGQITPDEMMQAFDKLFFG